MPYANLTWAFFLTATCVSNLSLNHLEMRKVAPLALKSFCKFALCDIIRHNTDPSPTLVTMPSVVVVTNVFLSPPKPLEHPTKSQVYRKLEIHVFDVGFKQRANKGLCLYAFLDYIGQSGISLEKTGIFFFNFAVIKCRFITLRSVQTLFRLCHQLNFLTYSLVNQTSSSPHIHITY